MTYRIANTKSLLSTLWVFVLLNMIFRDLHQFASQGFIEELMAQQISDVLLLFFGFVLEVPIVMVVLSRILPNKINAWANCIAVPIMLVGFISVVPQSDLDDVFFMIVESIALVVIAILAWRMPQQTSTVISTKQADSV